MDSSVGHKDSVSAWLQRHHPLPGVQTVPQTLPTWGTAPGGAGRQPAALLTCTLPRGQEVEALRAGTLVALGVHGGQEAEVAAQTRRTGSGIPWEQRGHEELGQRPPLALLPAPRGCPAQYSRGGCCSTCSTVKAETGARSSTACSWGEALLAATSSVPSAQKKRLSKTARPSGSAWLRRTEGKEWRPLPSTRSVSMDWGWGAAATWHASTRAPRATGAPRASGEAGPPFPPPPRHLPARGGAEPCRPPSLPPCTR